MDCWQIGESNEHGNMVEEASILKIEHINYLINLTITLINNKIIIINNCKIIKKMLTNYTKYMII